MGMGLLPGPEAVSQGRVLGFLPGLKAPHQSPPESGPREHRGRKEDAERGAWVLDLEVS